MPSKETEQKSPNITPQELCAILNTEPLFLAAGTLADGDCRSDEGQQSFIAMSDRLKKAKDLTQQDIEDRLALNLITLDQKFNELLQMATPDGKPSNLTSRERGVFYKLAFDCQEQIRRTADTLNKIKNPKPQTVFIKNQVVQQVNRLEMETKLIKQKLDIKESRYAPLELGSEKEAGRAYSEAPTLD